MIHSRLISSLALAGLACVAVPAQSATMTYGFDTLLSGHPALANDDFASLKVTTGPAATDPWTFRLHAYDLSDFGPWAFFGALAVDGHLHSAPKILSTKAGSGIKKVSLSPGGGPGGAFEFRFDLTNQVGWKKDRLTTGEWVEWTMSGISSISGFGGHIQGIGLFGLHSAWYGSDSMPSPVPLPATLWLAISALLGFLGLKRWRTAKPHQGDTGTTAAIA